MNRPADPLPLAGLMASLVTDPGRPRLTWYGPGSERIELSGHVLDNWVTKTTNLLVEEFSAGPGTVVLVDLPVHWRTVVWAFAVWRTGACVTLPPSAEPSQHDVVVTHRPAEHSGPADVVAVALRALARTFGEPLPPGAVDAATAVMTYGDLLTWLPEARTRQPALDLDGRLVSHEDLLAWAARTCPVTISDGERVLLEPTSGEVSAVLASALCAYAAQGSVVLCDPEVSAALAQDEDGRAHLIDTERVSRP